VPLPSRSPRPASPAPVTWRRVRGLGLAAIAAAVLASVPGPADAAGDPPARGTGAATLDLESARDAGWQEAVVSVRDAAPLLRFLTEVAGWQLRFEQPLPAATLAFYGSVAAAVPGQRGSGGMASAAAGWSPSPRRREWLVSDAAGRPGFVRLVAFDRPGAPRIRAGAMPWDTGGLLSLMTRSNDLRGVHAAALDQGWTSFNEPTLLDMRDSGVRLDNVLLRGPDGVVVSVYERLSPRMPDEPDLRRLRRPFNSMQSVRDLAAARRFYVDVLGFEVLNEGRFENPERAPNNFGVPANLVVAQPLRFAILGPSRSGPTQVELVQFPGVEGRDLAARALPPALGLLALRFPVSRLDALEARLRKAAIPVAAGPAMLDIAPYGRVRLLAVRAPDGAWLEFYERIAP
jgi:catechol 2,3-dioxygenase-like lactoylglutathione lyase family enzyme